MPRGERSAASSRRSDTANLPTTPPDRVFIDSSVLIAAAISPTGSARELLLRAIRGKPTLCVSQLVLDETERNLRKKAAAAVPVFELLGQILPAAVVDPPASLVLLIARVIELKDAPIIAGAVHAKCSHLATFDRKHLLSHKGIIHANYGIAVVTPDEVIGKGAGFH